LETNAIGLVVAAVAWLILFMRVIMLKWATIVSLGQQMELRWGKYLNTMKCFAA